MVNDRTWFERLLVLRGWGRQSSVFGEKANSELLKNRFGAKLGNIPYDNKFIFSEIGYQLLPLEVSSAFALEQLKKLPGAIKRREENYKILTEFFSTKKEFFLLPDQLPNTETVWLAFPLIIKKGAPFTRLEITTFLENENIQTRPIFTGNVLLQPGYKKIKHRKAVKSFPNADLVTKNGFVVACHHGLSKEQTIYLKDKFVQFLSKYK